jgi:heptosyltransferase-2
MDTRESKRSGTIVYGAFKGMGDLLNASPVIAAQLNDGHKIKLLLFPGMALEEFVELIDFGPRRSNLEILHLPVSGGLKAFWEYLRNVTQFQADLVWISPHAPREASSWKIPLLLWLTKSLFWRKATMAGAASEHLSRLFDVKVPVDRALPLFEREKEAFSKIDGMGAVALISRVSFVDRVRKHRDEPPKHDLLIHPGANASNRSWPYGHYRSVVSLLPSTCSIVVLGLRPDLEQMQHTLPSDRGIQFITGSLEDALVAIARARVVLAMDSGTAHFAQALNVPAVALFGKSDPDTIIGRVGSVFPIYEHKFACQPCGRAVCSQPEVYCMNAIKPEVVATKVLSLLKIPEVETS